MTCQSYLSVARIILVLVYIVRIPRAFRWNLKMRMVVSVDILIDVMPTAVRLGIGSAMGLRSVDLMALNVAPSVNYMVRPSMIFVIVVLIVASVRETVRPRWSCLMQGVFRKTNRK